jgi:hypothetical protein
MTITGEDTVARTMRQASRSLADMTTAHKAAAGIIADAAQGTAPRLTGALAAATRPEGGREGAGISNDLPYFGPIHYGWAQHNIEPQPFVDEAVTESQDEWFAVYEHAVQDACDEVKGA